jgi:hypothetical protein
MRTIELWRWRVRGLNGRQHVTRYAMTEAEALQRDPQAVRVVGTIEVREVPETAAEVARLMPGHTMRSGLVRRLGWWRQPEAWSAERR